MIFGREEEERKPDVLGVGSVGTAVALHVAAFLLLYLFAMIHLKVREQAIPIDLTVVVNENLDGEEDEPPPLKNERPPEPEPPKPPPPPPEPKVEPKVEAVEQVAETKKPDPPKEKPKPKAPEKPKEPEKRPDPPKPPEKTPEQLREERMRRMRESASEVKTVKIEVKDKPSGNGRTAKQTMSEAEIRKLLEQGYKPGAVTQLSANEKQRCISLIREAFYSKWNRPPWTDTLKEMHMKVRFDANGRVVGYRLAQSSGDPKADATVLDAAALVHMVSGLSTDFLRENSEVTVKFKVTPQ